MGFQKFLFLVVLLLNSHNSVAFHILIDPGHGGTDRGAVRGSIIESKIAFDVSQKLVDKLKSTPGITVSQTRETDKNIPLKERVKIADELNLDLFISIHVNSSADTKAKGTEFYFATTQSKEYDEVGSKDVKEKIVNDYLHLKRIYQSKQLADIIADQNKQKDLVNQKRKILQAPFFVISKTKIPSLLVELGFLTNPEESNLLMSTHYQNELSTEIYDGILSYIAKTQPLKN